MSRYIINSKIANGASLKVRRTISRITVSSISALKTLAPYKARLQSAFISLPCAIGKKGMTYRKREGDGRSPQGHALRILKVYYRADRVLRPHTQLPVQAIGRGDGWCDAPQNRNYNRPVRLPYAASTESLWRDDHVYDVVLDLSWNRAPVQKGRGSAIFMHCSEVNRCGTAGCIALSYHDLRKLLPRLSRHTRIVLR